MKPLLSRQRGMSMTETLVAVVVLAVGLLGVAGMQTTNIRNSQSASQRTMAVVLVSNMAERIRANRALAGSGVFALAKTCDALSLSGSIQNVEKTNWLAEIRLALGAVNTSCGEVVYDQTNRQYSVIVSWSDARGTAGAASQSVRQVVRL